MEIVIGVQLCSGRSCEWVVDSREVCFERCEKDLSLCVIRQEDGYDVKVQCNEPILNIRYWFKRDMENYYQVLIPDSGRFAFAQRHLYTFWGASVSSKVSNVCVPLVVFEGQDHGARLCFGVIGHDYETDFINREPSRNRALLAYHRRLSMEIVRGGAGGIPIEFQSRSDGAFALNEKVYLKEYGDQDRVPWVAALRVFCRQAQERYHTVYETNSAALEPYWCSWTDWHSNNVTAEVILRNVALGASLGIKNYIIDDGWFGPGLDNDYDVILNIGDWQPDPAKIPSLPTLCDQIRELGARPLIWVAPHAVGEGAKCHEGRMPLLVANEQGEPIQTSNGFHILCVQCPEAREEMARLCARLASEGKTDGAKYDLFNCIPASPCKNPNHKHDTESPIVGLRRTMQRIYEEVKKINPDYLIELKQNYGGPFLSQYGTVTRAGDTPYNSECNFLRTAYVQAYTPYALNDYQTLTSQDHPIACALVVIKMMASGIPSYSIDFDRLKPQNQAVLRFLNHWYLERLDFFQSHRKPMNTDLTLWRAESADGREAAYFVVNNGCFVCLNDEKRAFVLNGTMNDELLVTSASPWSYQWQGASGEDVSSGRLAAGRHCPLPAVPGGVCTLTRIQEGEKP